MFLLSSPTQVLPSLTCCSPSPQNLCDFTEYESPSNLQSTSTWVGVTTEVGCSIILNAVKGQTFFSSNTDSYSAGRKRTCHTVTLSTTIKQKVEFHIIIRSNWEFFSSQWFATGGGGASSRFYQTGICHRKNSLVSSPCSIFYGSHKTECSMGYTTLQNYLTPAVE